MVFGTSPWSAGQSVTGVQSSYYNCTLSASCVHIEHSDIIGFAAFPPVLRPLFPMSLAMYAVAMVFPFKSSMMMPDSLYVKVLPISKLRQKETFTDQNTG